MLPHTGGYVVSWFRYFWYYHWMAPSMLNRFSCFHAFHLLAMELYWISSPLPSHSFSRTHTCWKEGILESCEAWIMHCMFKSTALSLLSKVGRSQTRFYWAPQWQTVALYPLACHSARAPCPTLSSLPHPLPLPLPHVRASGMESLLQITLHLDAALTPFEVPF